MRQITFAAAAGILTLTSIGAQAFDHGWGAPYNSHLSEYDGRPLGPPLTALPPGYDYYNGRLVRVPYYYRPGRIVQRAPRYVIAHRTARARHRH